MGSALLRTGPRGGGHHNPDFADEETEAPGANASPTGTKVSSKDDLFLLSAQMNPNENTLMGKQFF